MMFKVGDKLVVVGARGHSIDVGSEVTVVEVLCNLPRNSNYRVADKKGLVQWVYNDDLVDFHS